MSNKIDANYLLLQLGLYEPIPFNETNAIELEQIFNDCSDIQFDCYCIECKKDSTFKFHDKKGLVLYLNVDPDPTKIINRLNTHPDPINLIFKCQRDSSHLYSFMIRIINNEITKVGQFPSIASLELHSIDKYRKILKSDYRDFSKAIGLYSHGIGAGSFVYLRRIFENLIEECRQEAQKEGSFDDDAFQRSKMDEKILTLKAYLPSFLVENRKLYGILSKGIHELDEQTCLALFPNVKLAIELILDEKIHQIEKQNKIQSASKFIAATVAKLKK
ncbi:short-chain dehydrogenase [Bacillus thuringiensis]|uniref:short-chain dehydrogenase n=1 Tax=Bacillus thuringiensis TaxID=1428 RepID=UPI000BF53301|nr:short-chain dehydrogenase [Bacillus thuringiensis]PFV82349.1 short-chain dehydrogenase [Bacillus thuringiensis]